MRFIRPVQVDDPVQLAVTVVAVSDHRAGTKIEMRHDLENARSGEVVISGPDIRKGVEEPILTCLEQAVDEAVNSESYGELMTRLENEPLNLGPERTREVVAENAEFYKSYLAAE